MSPARLQDQVQYTKKRGINCISINNEKTKKMKLRKQFNYNIIKKDKMLRNKYNKKSTRYTLTVIKHCKKKFKKILKNGETSSTNGSEDLILLGQHHSSN